MFARLLLYIVQTYLAALGGYLALPALVTHGHIAVVPAQKHLISLSYYPAGRIHTGIDRGLAATGAHRFYLSYGIRQLHQPPCAGEKADWSPYWHPTSPTRR